DFRRPVIEAIAEYATICEHAHLPLQSKSTRILKAMRRTYSRERYRKLVDDLRAGIPDLALTTDIIVGFPGETEDDFRQTIKIVEKIKFDNTFTFIYSPRTGTNATTIQDQIPNNIKHNQIKRLIEIIQQITTERNTARIDHVKEILIKDPSRTDPAFLRGQTRR